jgi:hypothetical protein
MRSRPSWTHVVVALGVIAALAIAAPAFGVSKSIKKAIKAEVAKQIGNATGPPGAPGANGKDAFGRLDVVTHSCDDNADGTQTKCHVECPAGEYALGGGGLGTGGIAEHQQLNGSAPEGDVHGGLVIGYPGESAIGWVVWVNNETGGTDTAVDVYAECAPAGTVTTSQVP